MANNVISFNDAVLELQKLSKAAANQEKYARADANMQRVMVGLDAMGNKELQKEEDILKKEEKHQESMEETLLDIKKILLSISKTIETAITSGIGPNAGSALAAGTELTENDQEAAQAKKEADDKETYLTDKLIEGITGLKKATEEGFGKMSAAYAEGAGGGGGILGGLMNLLSGGKGLLGKAGGGLAGMARSGLGMLSKAGPLAGAVGIGMAGFNVVNDVMGNIDKSNEIEENVKSGALTRDQGNVLQGESLGDTAGTAAGAAIGGIAGSALGPLGTAAGMWLGSKVGGFVGGTAGKYGVKAYQGIKSMLGFGETQQEQQAKMSPEQKLMNQYSSGEINAEEYNKKMKLQSEGGSAPPTPTPVSAQATPSPITATPVSAQATPSPITATPTQEPSKASGLTGMGKSIADKASSLGAGISSWFGGTKVGKAWAERSKGVGYNGVGSVDPEELVSAKSNLSETTVGDKYVGVMNEGVTVEKSALGSSWLGKLISTKGTETENFLSNSSKTEATGANGDVKFSQFSGSRKNGGWFGKDEYTITDPTTGEPVKVDKSTYMKAKDIAAKGGDASAIGSLLAKDQQAKEAAGMAPATTAMGDNVYGASAETASAKEDMNKGKGGTAVVNAPTVVNNTTQQANVMRSPIKHEESSLNRYMGSRYAAY